MVMVLESDIQCQNPHRTIVQHLLILKKIDGATCPHYFFYGSTYWAQSNCCLFTKKTLGWILVISNRSHRCIVEPRIPCFQPKISKMSTQPREVGPLIWLRKSVNEDIIGDIEFWATKRKQSVPSSLGLLETCWYFTIVQVLPANMFFFGAKHGSNVGTVDSQKCGVAVNWLIFGAKKYMSKNSGGCGDHTAS